MEQTNDKRIVIIGDIHGCFLELKSLLAKIGWTEETKQDFRIITLGDLVDRGPDSLGVVRFIQEQGFESVKGNHDDRYVKYHDTLLWHENNPGNPKPTWIKHQPERLEILSGLSQEDIEWIRALPTVIFIDKYRTVLVHAGFMPGLEISKQHENTKMHIRFLYPNKQSAFLDKKNGFSQPEGSYFWAEEYQDDWHVVYGHHVWDLDDIKIHTTPRGFSTYGIDTGACYGGFLTGLELSKDGNHIIHQVESTMPREERNNANRI